MAAACAMPARCLPLRSQRLPSHPAPRRGTSRAPRPRLFPAASASAEQPGPAGQPDDQPSDDQPSTSAPTSSQQLPALDLNQLQTALRLAIASEDYALASKVRDLLRLLVGGEEEEDGGGGGRKDDWRSLGVLPWLAERAEALGFRLPTEVQKRSARVLLGGSDAVVSSQTGSGKTLGFLLPALSLLSYPPDTYPDDLEGPAAVVVVPTRELGVQVVMLIYRLFGGNVNQGVPGAPGSIFDYSGPRGLKVKGLLLESELEGAKRERYLQGAHVVVGTPDLLAAAMEGPEAVEVVQHCRVLIVDEVDACFQEAGEQMRRILDGACGQRRKPAVVLVGATVDDALVDQAESYGWLADPVTVRAGPTMSVPHGLSHRFIVVPDDRRRLAAMCRQMRLDLQRHGDDAAPARVMVFASSEDQARRLSDPLRSVLWGAHAISVLLPGGAEPIKALHAFRDNRASLLLATPAAARGLDLPAVSHVYNVAPPAGEADYLHRAGRAGRIGSTVRGVVTTMVTPEQLPDLRRIADALGVELEEAAEPAPDPALSAGAAEGAGAEAARQALEDLFNMY